MTVTDLNPSTAIRPGEELAVEALINFIQQHIPCSSSALTVEQFPHGHSNLTYLLRWADKELVLRRPPFGNQVATAHDMGREYRILNRLHVVYPAAPKPLCYCDDISILGAPFYIMQRCQGRILRKHLPADLVIDCATASSMSRTLIDQLVQLHQVDYRAAGLEDIGKPAGYVQRQVSGWIKRYQQAQTDQVPAMEQIALWLSGNQPKESDTAIIHNDFKYDNVIFAANDLSKITGVLDWEMATIGDPLMDLGTSLGYWVQADDPVELQQAAFGPTALPGSWTRRQVWEYYQECRNIPNTDPLFYYLFGLFKLSVIVQQIYARFAKGQTQDKRFAHLNQLVTILSKHAVQRLNAGQI